MVRMAITIDADDKAITKTVTAAAETTKAKPRRDDGEAIKAYAKVPSEVVLDARLGAETLALLAYRATHIGNWSLQRLHINRVFAVGDQVFDRAIRQLQEAGYITRSRARDGTARQAVGDAFVPVELRVLAAGEKELPGKTARQHNPHRPDCVASIASPRRLYRTVASAPGRRAACFVYKSKTQSWRFGAR